MLCGMVKHIGKDMIYEFCLLICRVKGQVKSRMSVLLQEEESHRTRGADFQTKSMGSSSSSMGMRTTEGKGGGRENGRSTVGAEAEVIYSSSKGVLVIM